MALFLSTPSARRATWNQLLDQQDRKISIHALREEGDKLTETRLRLNTDFYPRPPRGGRPRVVLIINQFVIISIHALREEGDQMAQAMGAELVVFLSTPSARRATALDM